MTDLINDEDGMAIPSDIRSAAGLLEQLLRGSDAKDIAVRFWDGSTWASLSDHEPSATLVLRHEESLSRLMRFPPQLGLGEAYIYDDVDIEGSMDAFVAVADHFMTRPWTLMDWLRCGAAWWRHRYLTRLPEEARSLMLQGRRHEKRRDKEAVRFHYDLPIEFYRLWLDRQLLYSCAYYRAPDDGLNDAQEQQLEYICRKLGLKAGDRVLDIGCGWGGFAVHAAQAGAVVHGITLSRRQAEIANQSIAALGLSRRCRIEVRDYRDVQGDALYDKIVSIGMIEHVGKGQLDSHFDRMRTLLAPGGMCLIQGIGTRDGRPKLGAFADRYVFPDAELLPLEDIVRAAEYSGFEVRDVESLREHYALTLDAWRNRLEQHHQQAVRIVGEVTYRVWRVYMAMAAHLFRVGRLGLYQTLCVKSVGGKAALPLTRHAWYEPLRPIRTRKDAA
ncbi:MAG TPA: cyclopropane-fatty-acyl-phospholipid synthase family protein [Nitrospiraceae bacterium]